MSIRSLHNSGKAMRERGFTLLEVVVAMGLGLTVGALVLSATMSNKRLMNYDVVRTRIDQNLRSSMDLLSSDLRVGGENLTSVFPAFEVTNGTSGAPDVLIVRRNLLDEVLNVCQAISAGSSGTTVSFAVASPPSSACVYSNNSQNYNSWRTYRLANSNSATAFIYNISTRLGEFFTFTGENNGGTFYNVTRPAGTWVNSYTVGSSSVYILEEWRFQISNGLLQVVENGDALNVKNIATGLTNMQVVIHKSDGTTATSWTRADRWNQIDSIEVTLSAAERSQGRLVNRAITSRFFPRNVLSQ